MSKKKLQDAIKLMGEGKELHVYRGLLMNPTKTPKEDGTYYFTFDLKCLKNFGDDTEYGQSYNMYHMLIPVDLSQEFTNQDIQNLKNNEVYVLAENRSSVRKTEKGIFNNISYYVSEIELSRQVLNKVTELKKIESL